MTNIEIEKYVRKNYPIFSEKLFEIETELIKNLDSIQSKHPERIRQGDFRPGIIGRIVSNLICTRFLIDKTLNFINTEAWAEIFQETYVPTPWKGKSYFEHFKGIDLAIRFNLFHSIYHNIEATIRLICNILNLNDRKKPIAKINDLTNVFDISFIELIDAVRNTIHNNGYYQPVGNQRKSFKYKDNQIDLTFNENMEINVDTRDTIVILNKYIEFILAMIVHPKIDIIPITKDKN